MPVPAPGSDPAPGAPSGSGGASGPHPSSSISIRMVPGRRRGQIRPTSTAVAPPCLEALVRASLTQW